MCRKKCGSAHEIERQFFLRHIFRFDAFKRQCVAAHLRLFRLNPLIDAKKAGKIRFIGFTGHKDPAVHLRMLELAASNNFHFDSAQMPLNLLDAHFRSFEKNVVPKLVQQSIAVLGMKPLAER